MEKDRQPSPSLAPDSSPLKSGSMPVVRLLGTPFAPGELIGDRYRVERVIAEGGMGVIVAARHLELEETVAIKFLKDEFASKPEIVGRFAREAKAAAKIKCEYTATVHDVGISTDRGPYIVMEYLEGRDLEAVLQSDRRIPYARAVELMMQAGEAIGVAHANGIIHRDIKPANLFLVKSEHDVPIVKVLDFGVSKAALTGNMFGGAISLVKTQSLVGSPIYMSPEQIRGNQESGFAADIWSMGAVLYELVTGATAFTGSSITELCAAVLETEPLPITARIADVPAGLSDTIMRCLEKDPAKRWPTVAELVVALAPYAPKRARMSVDRVVAVSKSAGLVPLSFTAPTTIAPPPSSGASIPAIPSSSPTPLSLLETRSEAAQTSRRPALILDEEPRPSSSKRAAVVGVLLLAAAGAMGAIYLAKRSASPAASLTSTVEAKPTPPPAPAAPAPATPETAITVTPSPTVAATPPPAVAHPTMTTPRPNAVTGALRGAVPGRPAAMTAKTTTTPPPPAPAETAPTQKKSADQVKSAIDDRK
jgi:serine/threonine-protein kinase